MDEKLQSLKKEITELKADLQSTKNLLGTKINSLKLEKEQLKKRNKELEDIFATLPDAIIYTNKKDEIISVNASFTKIFGYHPDEVKQKPIHILYKNKISNKKVPENKDINIRNGIHEKTCFKKNGEKIISQTTVASIKNETGLYHAKLYIIRDITEQKQTTDDHIRVQKRYETMAKNFPNGAIFLFDKGVRYKMVAGKALEPVGLKSEYCIGKTVYELFPEKVHRIAGPADEAIFQDQKVYYEIEYQNRIYANWGVPIKNDAGEVIEGLIYAVEITDLINKKHKLEESEAKFASIIENINALVFELVTDTSISYISPNCTDFLGYKPYELLGKKLYDFIHKDDIEKLQQLFTNYSADENNHKSIEYRIKQKNGNLRWHFVNISRLKDKQDKTVSLVGVARDISEQKEYEEDLQFQSLLLKNISDLITATDLQGNIIYVNEAVSKLQKREKEKIIGTNVQSFGDDPEVGASQTEIIENTRLTGKWRGEVVNYDANGEPMILDCRTELVYDEAGKPKFMIGISTDITKRKQFENELQMSNAHFTSLLRNPKQYAIYRIKTDKNYSKTEVIKVSPSLTDMLGISTRKLHRFNSWFDNVKPDDLHILNESIYQAQTPPFELDQQIRIVHPAYGDRWLYLRANGIPFEDNPAKFEYANGIILDITEQKKAEYALKEKNEEYEAVNEELRQTNEELIYAKEQAEESDRLKSAFLANMSHEIRTPMNGIIGFAEMLRSTSLSETKREYYINIINKSCNQLLAIINDILDISKIETYQVKIFSNKVNINEIINDLLLSANEQMPEKNITVLANKTLPDDACEIITDEGKLKQILNNLINNALKYTVEGSIEFGYTIKSDQIEFYVKDTGIGIPKDKQKIIFERFVRGENYLTGKHGGTGLGLTICKAYIELLDGRIWLESQIDIGTTFFFTIPYNPSKKLQNTNDQALLQETTNEKKLALSMEKQEHQLLHILIVEDEEINSFYIEEILTDYNVKVSHANNGKEAVEIFTSNQDIDLILMDIKMPIMDGYEATQNIRKINNEIPIIALTAYTMSSDRKKALQAGCNDHIPKPVKPDKLIEVIKKYLNIK